MGNNNPIIRVIKRECEMMLKKWPLVVFLVLAPLASFVIIACIFSENVPRELPVAVVDLDHTYLSRLISRMTDATSIAKVNRSYISLDDAQNAMKEGNVDAILYIPDGTQKFILKGQSSSLALYLNNVNVVKASLLNSGIRKAIATISAGIKLKKEMLKGYTRDQAMGRILPVQVRSMVLFNPYISYSYFLLIALMPVVLVVFTLFGTTYFIGNELLRGTGPQWLGAANNNIIYALIGKNIPYAIIMICVAMVMNLIIFKNVGLPLNGSISAILLSELLLIICYQFIAIFFMGLFRNLRLSLSIGSAYSMLAITYSGLTFPVFGMSPIAQAMSYA
ncbi:MAG: ABC transporter permease, partial [Bacteroidota bacterium]|nr:ABC transporter permease [Bacteroidota bacterium]